MDNLRAVRPIDAEVLYDKLFYRAIEAQGEDECTEEAIKECMRLVRDAPTIDAVEVVRGHHIGDFCIYSFANKNKSLAIVEIVKILNDERGVAEVKFHKVIVDDTGNGFFEYLLKTGGTMNASLCYLKNITPSGERRSDG